MPEPDEADSLPSSQGVGAAAATTGMLPAGFTCPKCDYDLGGASVQVCSECGRPIEPMDVVIFRRRGNAVEALRAATQRFWRCTAVVQVVMGGGAMMLALDVGAAIVAVVLCGIALVGSVGAGWLAASLAPKGDRAAIRVVWVGALPWLNAPWLVLPVFAIGGVVCAFVVLGMPRGDDINGLGAMMLGFLGMCVWVLVSLGSVVVGVRAFGAGLREYGVKRRAWWPGIVVAFLIVIGGAMLLGFCGMVFAADGAYSLVAKWK